MEDGVDRLYGLPLDEFVGARDELAKELRGEGNREEADQVKALRKPPVAAWLVNQISRERELDVRRLLDAAEALRKAQSAGSEEFAEARRNETHALERLSAAAREIAKREGTGHAVVDRATQTIRAAAATEEGRELLRRGRLTEELEPPGFEVLTGLVPATRRPKKNAPPRPPRPSKQARERVERLRKAEREAEREAERAEMEATRLRAKAEAAAEARAQAEKELEQ